jgi:recombination DNA repair RAD52 pathway protein
MSESVNVMSVPANELKFKLDDAKNILEQKLKPEWVKQRTIGGTKLDYIEGARVIEILNSAFNYQWSFEIITSETIQAEDWYNRYTSKFEPQGKYVQVLGKLTVPGLGVKMAYGSKTIIGKTSEQESVFKSAMTDALKKCATMFGIAKELYLDSVDTDTAPSNNNQQSNNKQNSTQSTGKQYDPADVNALKEFKAVLGITENTQLDPLVKDWSGGRLSSFKDINPENIRTFNAYLKTKC